MNAYQAQGELPKDTTEVWLALFQIQDSCGPSIGFAILNSIVQTVQRSWRERNNISICE